MNHRKERQKFYEDFFDIYFADEIKMSESETLPYYRESKKYNDYNTEYEMEEFEMMNKRIQINNYNDIKAFVALASKYGDNLMIKGRNYEFPACSLMSVMSLVDLSNEIKIQFSETICSDILTDFDKWIINNE